MITEDSLDRDIRESARVNRKEVGRKRNERLDVDDDKDPDYGRDGRGLGSKSASSSISSVQARTITPESIKFVRPKVPLRRTTLTSRAIDEDKSLEDLALDRDIEEGKRRSLQQPK